MFRRRRDRDAIGRTASAQARGVSSDRDDRFAGAGARAGYRRPLKRAATFNAGRPTSGASSRLRGRCGFAADQSLLTGSSSGTRRRAAAAQTDEQPTDGQNGNRNPPQHAHEVRIGSKIGSHQTARNPVFGAATECRVAFASVTFPDAVDPHAARVSAKVLDRHLDDGRRSPFHRSAHSIATMPSPATRSSRPRSSTSAGSRRYRST